MFDSTIGIKMANGEYYSILSEGSLVRRRLILTTVNDNQERVQINLFKGGVGESAESTSFLGSLLIENIEPSPRGNPEIELILGVDAEGRLSAAACDSKRGEYQSLSVNLDSPEGLKAHRWSDPELKEDISLDDASFEKNDLTRGESPPHRKTGEKKPQRRWVRPLFFGGFILVGVAIVMLILLLLFRGSSDKSDPPLNTEETSVQEKAEPEEETAPKVSAEAPAEPETAPPGEPVAEPSSPESFRYLIKRGDTLWDLSNSFYRTPWLYRKIAKDNGISNPDLIYAGTKLDILED